MGFSDDFVFMSDWFQSKKPVVGNCFICAASAKSNQCELLQDGCICKACISQKEVKLQKKGPDGKHPESMLDVVMQIKENGFATPGEFTITKRVFCQHPFSFETFDIDEGKRLFSVPSLETTSFANVEIHENIYKFEDLIDFELMDNGIQVIDGNSLIGAVAGGLTFGDAGAIVGSSLRDKRISKKCSSLVIKLVLNNIKNPTRYIYFIKPTGDISFDTNDIIYKRAYSNAQECLSLLTVILKENRDNSKKKVVIEHDNYHEADTDSVVIELRKFKELLDDGIITQDEFNAKKKQLLGL